ncbi:MAG TPA: tetratricopeptide repeat protein [Vicinamibacterales bacterium]|nr:tetratricopeptide repeat protein [Vicinamibacterales bacterium]
MKASRTLCAGLVGALVLALLTLAAPASAQTGQLKGKVVDGQNKPLSGAKITMLAIETNRKYETKSDSKGEWRQIGLPPGKYTVTAEKDGMTQTFDVGVTMDTKEVNFSLQAGGAGGKMTAEQAKKEAERIDAIKSAFAQGAELSNAGKHEEAIAKFNEVLAQVPKCVECYVNIGAIHSQKQEWVKAEEAYKKALEINPDSVQSYTGLANVYNAQKKFTEAQAMSAEATKRMGAAGGGNADSLYNQGVIAWNGNDFPKAQELFVAAIKANDKHAEAHFMLGQAYLNLGKLPEAAKEFETYTKLAPTGPNAEKAKANFEMLKQYIK